jgi:hypothetical protein
MGNTMTLSTSAYGIFTAFGWIKDSAVDYEDWGPFTRLGASATFNLTNPAGSTSSSTTTSTSDTLASANHREISQWQIKFPFKDTSIRSAAVTSIFNGSGSHKQLGAASGLKTATENANERSLSYLSTQVILDLSQLKKVDSTLNDLDAIVAPIDPARGAEAMQSIWTAIKSEVAKNPDCHIPVAAPTPDPCLGLEQALLGWLVAYKTSDADPKSYSTQVEAAIADARVWSLIQKYADDEANFLTGDAEFEADVKNLQAGWNGALTFAEQYPATGAATTTTTTTTSTTSTTTKPSAPAYLVSGLAISYQKPTATKSTTNLPSSVPAVTINFAGSVYPNPVASLNEQTFRGGTAATTLQWDLGKSPFLGSTVDKSQITLELSGQYQRLQENAGQAGKKADLALGNLKLEFPISSGVSFPLSITVANSSEQIKETYAKGNFGISFDLDKLAALLKAKQTTQ